MVKIYFTSKSGAFLQSEVKANDAVDFANDFLNATYSNMIIVFESNGATKEYVVSRVNNIISVETRSKNEVRKDSVEVENKNLLIKRLIDTNRSLIRKIAVFQ